MSLYEARLKSYALTLEEEIERLKAELDVRVGVQQALGQENNQLKAENDRLKDEQRLNERLRAEAQANLLGRDAYKEEWERAKAENERIKAQSIGYLAGDHMSRTIEREHRRAEDWKAAFLGAKCLAVAGNQTGDFRGLARLEKAARKLDKDPT